MRPCHVDSRQNNTGLDILQIYLARYMSIVAQQRETWSAMCTSKSKRQRDLGLPRNMNNTCTKHICVNVLNEREITLQVLYLAVSKLMSVFIKK